MLIRNEPILGHEHGRVFFLLADIDPRRDMSFEVAVMDQFRQPAGLVRGKGVHGIDEDRLYSRLPPVPVAVVKNGIDKAFRLSGPGAGGNNGGLRVRSGQAIKGFFLVQIRRKRHGQVREIVASPFSLLVRELDIQKRAFEDIAGFSQKILKDIGEKRRCYRKGGAQKILDALFNVPGQDGWDHYVIDLSSIWSVFYCTHQPVTLD